MTDVIAEEMLAGGGLDTTGGDVSRIGTLGVTEAVATEDNRVADAVSAFRDLA